MSILHKSATTKGAGPVKIGLNAESTMGHYSIRQLMIHCAATFTDVCTVSIERLSHEGTAYDTLVKVSTVATTASVLQNILWQPDPPLLLNKKDRISITFGAASAAMPWGYDAVLETGR